MNESVCVVCACVCLYFSLKLFVLQYEGIILCIVFMLSANKKMDFYSLIYLLTQVKLINVMHQQKSNKLTLYNAFGNGQYYNFHMKGEVGVILAEFQNSVTIYILKNKSGANMNYKFKLRIGFSNF